MGRLWKTGFIFKFRLQGNPCAEYSTVFLLGAIAVAVKQVRDRFRKINMPKGALPRPKFLELKYASAQ